MCNGWPPPGQGDEGTIEKIVERRNVFYRQDDIRTKTFAANLDQAPDSDSRRTGIQRSAGSHVR